MLPLASPSPSYAVADQYYLRAVWESVPDYMCKLTNLESVLRTDDLGEGDVDEIEMEHEVRRGRRCAHCSRSIGCAASADVRYFSAITGGAGSGAK